MKLLNHLVLLTLTLTFSSVVISDVKLTPAKSTIIKSKNDTRDYQTFILKNGMEVLLASDADLAQSAVSLTVGVGQFQDPIAQPGLAHYVEHMIFMGSEKHPQPNALMKLVKANNGVINAVTEAQQTSYFFSIANNKFEQALAMLSASIKAPLFKKEFAEKELNAIDAEWSAAKESDGFAMQRTNALTSAKNHPIRQFSIGNLSTLTDKKNSNLQAELKMFHQQYYSANIMKLAIVGNKSLTELALLAKEYFADIDNKNLIRPVTNAASFTKNNLQKQIMLQTKVQTDSLILQFPLANNSDEWAKKPNGFVHYMLTSEEDGALTPTLRDAGLIEDMQVIISPMVYGADGVILIDFSLTEQGTKEKDNIISAFFSYVNLIRQTGVTDSYAQELQNILQNQFNDFQNPDALSLASTFSRQMLDLAVVDILRHHSYFPIFNKPSVMQVLAQISPKKLRLWHISDSEKTDTNLVYAKGSYGISNLTKTQLEQWQRSDLALTLPKALVIDNDSDEMILSEHLTYPEKIIDRDGIQSWLMHSQSFTNNKGLFAIFLQSNLFQQDVKHHVMTNLLLTLLAKDLNRMARRAGKTDRVHVGGSQNKFGDLAFSFSGKTGKQLKYVEKLFHIFKHVQIEQKDLDRALKLYLEGTSNVDEAPLSVQANHYFNITTKTSPFIWNTSTKLQAAKSISLAELKQFHQTLLSNVFVDVFAFGHYDRALVKQMAMTVRNILGETTQKSKIKHSALYQPKAATLLSKKIDVKQDNVMLKDTYIYPQTSRKVSTQLQLLNKLFESSFFKTLRTNKQLGYEIGSYQEDVHQYPGFTLYIQSSNTDLQTLKEYFIGFLFQFEQALRATDEQVITQISTNMINLIEQKPRNIYVESQRYLIDWLEQRDNFNTNEQIVSILQATDKKDLQALYGKMLLDGHAANVMIQLRGTKFKETDFFDWKNLSSDTE